MEIKECALCKELKELQESHLAPKFVGKWLKDTSATGHLRQANQPNIRKQDLYKIPLLCHDCEEKFSVNEKYFSEKIFVPFQNSVREFHYDEWLVRFIISINWRFAIICDTNHLNQEQKNEVLKALEIWRRFLKGDSNNRGRYKHHIFFLDLIDSISPGMKLPKYANSYCLRTVDGTLVDNDQDVFIYSNLAGVMLISHIYPLNIKGWQGTRVENKGKLKIPQVCGVPGIGGFLLDRIKETNELMEQMDAKQKEKITQAAEKDIKRLEKSKSLEVILADKELERRNTPN